MIPMTDGFWRLNWSINPALSLSLPPSPAFGSMFRGGTEDRRAALMRQQNEWGDLPIARDQVTVTPRAPCHKCDSSPPPNMHRIRNQQAAQIQVPSCSSWSFQTLLARKNFIPVDRISATDQNLIETISDFDQRGLPLVVQDLHRQPQWDEQMLSIDWLKDKSGINDISVHNVHNNLDSTLSLSDFVKTVRDSPQYVQPDETERLYGKDLDCPAGWTNWLCGESVIPQMTMPTRDNIMSHLPSTSKVDTLMCYIGAGDTFTPSHKDSCASNGQNLMVYAENGGSSYWFMTKQEDARHVADYFHVHLGHDIDHESHVTSVDEFANAPFNVYVLEQKVGDLVLVPRMSCHQVVNNAGLTVKIAWSRLTVKGAIQALHHELPLYRRVCRREIYRIKFVLFYTTKALSSQIKEGNNDESCSRRLASVQLALDEVLRNECVSNHETLSCVSLTETYLSCDFCGADIFQSFFECEDCHAPDTSDSCTICPDCYVEGRGCRCHSMQPMQVQPLENILRQRRATIKILSEFWKSNAVGGVNFEPEKDLFDKGAFKAGCLLAGYREGGKGSKSCSQKGSRSEHPPLLVGDAVYCTHCHQAVCHYHLLHDCNLHACETILQASQNTTKMSHHMRHAEGRKRYQAELVNFMSKESNAEKVETREIQLVNLALNFPHCRPVNSNTRAGWYDEIIIAPVLVRFNNPPNSMAGSGSPPPPYEEGSRGRNNLSLRNNVSSAPSNSSTNTGPSNRATALNPSSTSVDIAKSSRQSKEKKLKLVFDGVLLTRKPSVTRLPPAKEQPQVIDLSSDSGASPLPNNARARGRRRKESKDENQRTHDEDMIVSGPNSNGKHAFAPSNFTNDLASAITASGVASTEESSASPSSSISRKAPTTSSRPVVPTTTSPSVAPTVKKTKTRSTEPTPSTSLGKRRKSIIQSDLDSSDDEQPIVARPHIPSKRPVTVGQNAKQLEVTLGKRRETLTTRPSFRPGPKREDRRTASSGLLRNDVPREAVARTSSRPPKADSYNVSKYKAPLLNFSKTVQSLNSEKMMDQPIAESSHMASVREVHNDLGGAKGPDNEAAGVHNVPQNVPAFGSPLMLPAADQSAMITLLVQLLHSSFAMNEQMRVTISRLENQVEGLERGKTHVSVQQQQQQAIENNLTQTQAFIQNFVPAMISQHVDSRMQSLLVQLMTNTSYPMGLPPPPPPNPPFPQTLGTRNDYRPTRARGTFSRGSVFPHQRSNSQHYRNVGYQDFNSSNRGSSYGPSRTSSSSRRQSNSAPVVSRHQSPRRESPHRESPHRGPSRQRIEPGTKVMDVDDPDNNPVEEGASRGSVNEDYNEDRIGPNRPDGNITHEGEADPQEWEMGYAADENNPWKEHPER